MAVLEGNETHALADQNFSEVLEREIIKNIEEAIDECLASEHLAPLVESLKAHLLLFDWHDRCFYYKACSTIEPKDLTASRMPFKGIGDFPDSVLQYVENRVLYEEHFWYQKDRIQKKAKEIRSFLQDFREWDKVRTSQRNDAKVFADKFRDSLRYVPQHYDEGASHNVVKVWLASGKAFPILIPPHGRHSLEEESQGGFSLLARMERFFGIGGSAGSLLYPLVDPLTRLLIGEIFLAFDEAFFDRAFNAYTHSRQNQTNKLPVKLNEALIKIGDAVAGRYFQILQLNKFVTKVFTDLPRFDNPNIAIGEHLSSIFPIERCELTIDGKDKVFWKRQQHTGKALPYSPLMRTYEPIKESFEFSLSYELRGIDGKKLDFRIVLPQDISLRFFRVDSLWQIVNFATSYLGKFSRIINETLDVQLSTAIEEVTQKKLGGIDYHQFAVNKQKHKILAFPPEYRKLKQTVTQTIVDGVRNLNSDLQWYEKMKIVGCIAEATCLKTFFLEGKDTESEFVCPTPDYYKDQLVSSVLPADRKDRMLGPVIKEGLNYSHLPSICLVEALSGELGYARASKKSPTVLYTEERSTVEDLLAFCVDIVSRREATLADIFENEDAKKEARRTYIAGPVKYLERVLNLALNDACSHCPSDSQIILKVKIDVQPRKLTLSITNERREEERDAPTEPQRSQRIMLDLAKLIDVKILQCGPVDTNRWQLSISLGPDNQNTPTWHVFET